MTFYSQMQLMLATASSQNYNSSEPSTSADDNLSWQLLTETTMSDADYPNALHHTSPDQKVVIDKVFSHNRRRILNNSTDQLLLFVTGAAGVGKSFLIRLISYQSPIAVT